MKRKFLPIHIEGGTAFCTHEQEEEDEDEDAPLRVFFFADRIRFTCCYGQQVLTAGQEICPELRVHPSYGGDMEQLK